MSNENWKLSPSDFAFLWGECKRCFYLKVVKGFYRPRPIMPKIFNIIDAQMKTCFERQRIENLVEGMPAGVVKHTDEWVEYFWTPFFVIMPQFTCILAKIRL